MPRENLRILLVSNPQTSKNDLLPQTDLLQVPAFSSVVREFDNELGLSYAGSLHPDRQIASVVMSIASHKAFITALDGRIQPGLIDSGNSRYKPIFTGHSVGEMASLIEAGVCSISTMAWMLNERERLTQKPLEAALRQMVAFIGVNADQLEANLHHFSSRFAGQIEFYIANNNTPRQVVLALKVLRGEVGTAIESLGRFIPEIRDPSDDSKSLFPKFRLHPLLPNGFHTAMMRAEEAIYIQTINPRLTKDNFNSPLNKTVYSPTLPGWVNTREDSFNVVKYILTKPVLFSEGIREINLVPGLAAIVTADVLGTTPGMIKDNIGLEVPTLNIKDKKTLDKAVETSADIISRIA